MKARNLKSKGFTATILVPAATPDGTSLEEKINTWLDGAGEKELVEVQYQAEGTNYTALIFYAE